MIWGKGGKHAVRGSRSFDFRRDSRMMLRNVCADVGGVVLQQEVADDGKRGLHDEGAVVSVKLLRDNEG